MYVLAVVDNHILPFELQCKLGSDCYLLIFNSPIGIGVRLAREWKVVDRHTSPTAADVQFTPPLHSCP